MKLRTRILLVSILAVLVAALIGDGIIWTLMERTKWKAAVGKAYQNSYQLSMEIQSAMTTMDIGGNVDVYLEYVLKRNGNDYDLCFHEGDSIASEIYNHTYLSYEELNQVSYTLYEAQEYGEMDGEGRKLLIFRSYPVQGRVLYHIEDISYVRDEMMQLAGWMGLITVGVTVITACILAVLLKRMLRPLQVLTDTTRRIAEGDYDQRMEIRRQDELGQLSVSFNKMADAVESRTHSLEESEYKKTLFMGNLTHELKTPMTAISGYAQTLLTTKLPKEEQEEALSYIYEECGRLERLSKKMMKLLELDQTTELVKTTCRVRELFEAAEKSCQSLLHEHRIQLVVEEHGEQIWADADLMTDVLINLIDNAVKASPDKATIYLRAEQNRILVQDFGSGIPKKEQDKILEPFYMIDKSRSRKTGGAGLGLALVQLILRQHSAKLLIDSQIGEGTSMIIQFSD